MNPPILLCEDVEAFDSVLFYLLAPNTHALFYEARILTHIEASSCLMEKTSKRTNSYRSSPQKTRLANS